MANIQKIVKVLLICFISCNTKTNKNEIKDNQNIISLNDKTTVLLNSSQNDWLLKKYGYQKWEPKLMDIKIVEEVIETAIQNKEFDFLKKPVKIHFKEYYLQYIPYLNENGERYVEVNAFCEIWEFPPSSDSKNKEWTKMDWKNEYVMVHDGGACYWRININIDKREYENLRINGIA